MPEICKSQRSDEWHLLHRNRITASAAAACLGLSTYDSRQKAWRSILGLQDATPENSYIQWGERIEPVARKSYEVLTGNIVTEAGFWVHPVYDWLGASPDGLIGKDGLVEIKCPGMGNIGKLPTSVPITHRIQCIVQLAVTGRKWVDYFSFVDGGYFLKRIFRSGVDGIVAKLKKFYETYILTGIEPERKKPRRRHVKSHLP